MQDSKYRVYFKFYAHYDTKTVDVIGDFNNWQKGQLRLEDNDGDNVWTGHMELSSGKYEYKYLIDDKYYVLDSHNPIKVTNHGFENSLLLVGEALLNGDAIHRGAKDVDFYTDTVMYFKLILNRQKYTGADLILVIHDTPKSIPGFVVYHDEIYSYLLFKYEDTATIKDCLYYFELKKKKATDENDVLYLGTNGVIESEWEIDNYELVRKNLAILQTPDWVKKAIFYQIFPDRFYDANKQTNPPKVEKPDALPKSDSFYGGDLEGVIEKVDHITELGANSVYFTPIFLSSSPHKYDTADYQKIDPHFGTEETYKKMVKTFQDKSLSFIMDGVFNHTGTDFWAFQDIVRNQEKSPYLEWYFVNKFPLVENYKPNYDCWWNFPELPKLNIDNPEVKKYILECAECWIKKGSSGWRLDVPNEIHHGFWKEFRKTVKSVNPEAYLIGEIWHNGSYWLNGDEFDSVMNYRFREACVKFFAKRESDAEDFVKEIGKQIYDYPMQANFAMFNLLSSHDTSRFYTSADKDLARVKLALAFQFTYIGAPSIYYGEEVGMEGDKDPDNRRYMVWDKERWNMELYEFYKNMIHIRRENDVLTEGDIRFFYVKNQIIGYERFKHDKKLVIFINNSDKNVHLDITKVFGNGDFIDISREHPLKRKKVYTLYANDFVILKKVKERV